MRGFQARGVLLSSYYSRFVAFNNYYKLKSMKNSQPQLGIRFALTEHYYQRNARKYWNEFYRRHENKFFKDRHYLVKDWGCFFSEDTYSSKGKVLLEVGCGSGNTVFPLLATYPNLYVHACDLSSHAIELLKSHVDFGEDRINAFVCNVAEEDFCDTITPSSVDVVTLIFMLSAVSPEKMPLILENIRRILKPHGYVLFRDYAVGDFSQMKFHGKNRNIGKDFYVREDGTCSFYFSEDFLSTLFSRAGFNTVNIEIYNRQITNRSQNVIMDRRWLRAVFRNSSAPSQPCSI